VIRSDLATLGHATKPVACLKTFFDPSIGQKIGDSKRFQGFHLPFLPKEWQIKKQTGLEIDCPSVSGSPVRLWRTAARGAPQKTLRTPCSVVFLECRIMIRIKAIFHSSQDPKKVFLQPRFLRLPVCGAAKRQRSSGSRPGTRNRLP
jgi:hypothetical protein